MRLDHYIAKTYSFTGNKAKKLIKSGLISVEWKIIQKAGYEISWEEIIQVQEDPSIAWVSRSAGKLDGFLSQLSITNNQLQISGTNCLDVGSSTGGFTQILLGRWASHIDCVDVGTDQLHPSLRGDTRVRVYEQTDIRDFWNLLLKWGRMSKMSHRGLIDYDIIVCDASFISLVEILPSILELASIYTYIILLWKPQFEVGRLHLRKTWVPKDEKQVLQRQKEWENFVLSSNCEILQKEKSTVIGEAGNQEWLYFLKKIH